MINFSTCETIAELNEAKSALLQDINKEYQTRKKKILETLPPYSRVNIVRAVEVKQEKAKVISAFHVIKGKVAEDVVAINKDGSVCI